MSYIVFLDIDGVFTSERYATALDQNRQQPDEYWSSFDPVAVQFMNTLARRYPVRFVLISTWKTGLAVDPPGSLLTGPGAMAYLFMLAAFRNAGFEGLFHPIWKTNPDNSVNYPDRAIEIKDWLRENGSTIKDYLIFDDNDYGFERVLGVKRWIKTSTTEGLLLPAMRNAKSITGTWMEN